MCVEMQELAIPQQQIGAMFAGGKAKAKVRKTKVAKTKHFKP
jgi:hypothetical protein